MATGSESDRVALLSLKDKFTNCAPEALPSWNDSILFCKWQGVTCSPRHMRVSALNLTNQNFGGTIAPILGNLTFLKLLNLSYNELHGQVPKQIGHLRRLQFLDLSKNHLEGEVPAELANCSKLEQIFFGYNNLTAKIPFWFGSMPQLTILNLGVNEFHGTIPSSLGNLSSLESLSLESNSLEGNIPQSLGGLSNLYLLTLIGNNLSDVIPSSFYNLSRLEYFNLGYNHFYGTIPTNIGLSFPNLQHFNVGGNKLMGTIPASLSNISQLEFFSVYENAFSGLIPTSLGRLQKLHIFLIFSNNFGRKEGDDLDFLSSLTNCSQLRVIDMFNNKFSSELPNSIGNFSSHLEWLGMGVNRITGSIPNEIGQLKGLIVLALQQNFLQGTFPHSVGKLENLGKLYLETNQLSGRIPDIFENLTKLIILTFFDNNFEGTIPVSLKHCKGLQFLYMQQNNLSGTIPNLTFGHLESLIYLNMSSNSLIGPIPSVIGNMKQLVGLYMSENNFSGDIPTELGECLELTDLDMSGNFLHGSIPSSFTFLKSLINLDLSNNNLSGTIPRQLKDFPILETLNLSHNHFYGEVPKGGVFDNITAISLAGNEKLCSGIPQLKLPKCPSKSKKHFKVIILIIVISIGALTSFAICLIICKRSKHKRFSSSTSSPQNAHLRVTYKELHDATNGFSSSNLVGVGSFGSVYKGTLQHFECLIVVKVLNLQAHGATKSFITECKTLSKVRHRNLLKILTTCSSVDYKGNDFKALVFEFMPNGSLENWLSANEPGEHRDLYMNFRQRLDVAIDVAHALDYLHHGFEEPIVHCDIKPSNVLLSDDMVAHLGDFGLARLLHEVTSCSGENQTTSSVIKGTIGYIPPEYGEGGQVTTKGDIYSYGILMLEMLTGKKPTDKMFHEDLSLPKFCKLALPDGVLEILDPNLLVLYDRDHRKVMRNSNIERQIQESLASFAGIGVACCAGLPGERMDIKDVLAELLAIKQKLSTFNIVI
ncbi:probable LRR receptor-like serine/threonine-protein kinase At3g47570 [Neltuma alba]|uniref:probable LRR receptor-like serine/threonine-protein kinase At3g47570 n=1 Tax=Neltuma alba TaxID=207710 RepID=UPI0010A31534|nr:probable LRR receptor-like serine/threonine-protein kinase At3g47570 [Prosopis alba]